MDGPWVPRWTDSPVAAMDLSYAFVEMELHSVGIRMGASPASNVLPSSTPQANRYRFELLLSCLEAGKAYLDILLAVPTPHYRLFSFIEWMRLPYVLIILSKLSFPSDNYADSHWDIRTAQELVRLDLYLEALCYRMSSITTFNGASQPHPDFFLSLKMILERTRHWYVRKTRVANVGDSAITAATGDPADEDSPLEIIRDPHERTTNTAPTQKHSPEEQTREPRKLAPMPTTGMSEATQGGVEVTQLPTMTGFEAMDDFMGNIDDTFWTSNIFEPALFPELWNPCSDDTAQGESEVCNGDTNSLLSPQRLVSCELFLPQGRINGTRYHRSWQVILDCRRMALLPRPGYQIC